MLAAAPSAAALEWRWLGRADYRPVLDDQLAERERVWAGAPGTIFLCEHPPVITLGRSANTANILAADGVQIERIERGGDVTYHGPGQLMVYPVVRVQHGVVEFLSRVAAALADACAALGAPGAEFHRDPAGIYYGDNKVGACGIHIARGVSVHGFALDVATPPDAWRKIRPCGLSLPQTSVVRELEARGLPAVSVEQVAREAGPRLVAALL
ncbi:MAG TPA: lipoyl(octanoyl) transferase LipB [Kofleriaceae bacterium]|nr:lipoyl(octanoyl) transferase LipB [Kofleriaceae bacterium]